MRWPRRGVGQDVRSNLGAGTIHIVLVVSNEEFEGLHKKTGALGVPRFCIDRMQLIFTHHVKKLIAKALVLLIISDRIFPGDLNGTEQVLG